MSTDHKAAPYVVFSTALLSRPYETHISSSAPYSLTPSAYHQTKWAVVVNFHLL